MTTNAYSDAIEAGLIEEAQFLKSATFRTPVSSQKYLDVEPWCVVLANGGYSVSRIVCDRFGWVRPEFRRPRSKRKSAFTLIGAKRIANKLNRS